MPTRLTDRFIRAIRPSKGITYVFDSEIAGLAIRTYPSGRKTFIFDYRQDYRQRRVTIGQFPAWTTGKARVHASRLRVRVDSGENVVPDRGQRVADLLETWRETVRVTRRPATAAGYIRLINAHIEPAFGKDVPAAITRNRVELWHGRIAEATPINANRALGRIERLPVLARTRPQDRTQSLPRGSQGA